MMAEANGWHPLVIDDPGTEILAWLRRSANMDAALMSKFHATAAAIDNRSKQAVKSFSTEPWVAVR
jgi:hypothetical protein